MLEPYFRHPLHQRVREVELHSSCLDFLECQKFPLRLLACLLLLQHLLVVSRQFHRPHRLRCHRHPLVQQHRWRQQSLLLQINR